MTPGDGGAGTDCLGGESELLWRRQTYNVLLLFHYGQNYIHMKLGNQSTSQNNMLSHVQLVCETPVGFSHDKKC